MLDIKFIRENTECVKEAIVKRHVVGVDIDELLRLDAKRSGLLQQVEAVRAQRNKISDEIGFEKDEAIRAELITQAKEIKDGLTQLEIEFKKIDAIYLDLLTRVPNVVSPDMPVGVGEEDNTIVKVWLPKKEYLKLTKDIAYTDLSYMPKAQFVHKDHVALGEYLGLIDVKQSALVSGSRFCYLRNEAVLLQDAILALMKKRLLGMGYIPTIPPILVKKRALFGTSHFPEGEDQVYKIENFNVEEGNELYLVGSSEPANFAYFMDKVLDVEELPIKLYAQTACFRSEVGSWGKDVSGIKRVHQFDKLEMNALCKPGQEGKIFEEFLETNEWILQQLALPYRVVNKCTGDCGYNASYFQYDIEVWRPGVPEFMEVMTNTITTDYQARRLNIRYKESGEMAYVYTINDTGVALGRIILAILENYQQKDGSVEIPKVLRPFMGGKKIIRA